MNKTFTAIVVLIVVVLGGYFLLKGPEVKAPGEELAMQSNEKANEIQVTNLIAYTNAGYSPQTLTIKVGDTVTFKNDSAQNVWTASGMHPTHTAYSGTTATEHCPDVANTAFDQCQAGTPGSSWSFKFDKAGSWKYHDHLHPSNWGEIVVQ